MPEERFLDEGLVSAFVEGIIADKGVDNLDKTEKEKLKTDLAEELDRRVEKAMLGALSTSKLAELEEKLERGISDEELQAFFDTTDLNFEWIAQREMVGLRNDFLNSKDISSVGVGEGAEKLERKEQVTKQAEAEKTGNLVQAQAEKTGNLVQAQAKTEQVTKQAEAEKATNPVQAQAATAGAATDLMADLARAQQQAMAQVQAQQAQRLQQTQSVTQAQPLSQQQNVQVQAQMRMRAAQGMPAQGAVSQAPGQSDVNGIAMNPGGAV